jgi:hypothetical protein
VKIEEADEGDESTRSTTVKVESDGDDESAIVGTTYLSPFLDFLAATGIVFLLVIFFLCQQADIRDRIVSVAGRGALATTTKALEDAGARISRYLLMQFIINATFGLAVTIGLLVIGVPYALMWGLFAGLLRYIPYIGPWIAALLPIATSLATSNGWTQPLTVVAMFVVLELISNNVMEPILYGHSVGLSEVGVILSAIFWAWIWGPIGLVLATPMTVCLVVLGKHVSGLRVFDHLLGERPPVGAPVRLYQRLLAKDEEEAEDLVRDFLKKRTVLETCDELLLPTVELVHQDLKRDQIDDDDAEWMLTAMRNQLVELPDVIRAMRSKEKSEETEPVLAEGPLPTIVGLPAQSSSEELVLRIVELAVADLPCRFETVSNELLVSERVAKIVELSPTAVCLSSFPPGDLSQARQLSKRLQQQVPGVKLLVGRWATQTRPERNDQLKSAGADEIVFTITDLHRLLSSVVNLERAGKANGGEREKSQPRAAVHMK